MGRKPFVVQRNAKESKVETHGELDYMSENVIEVIKETVVEKESRIPKKKAVKQPKSHSAMREDALATPLPESNIGFKLLKQMGYKEGEGLGKQKEGIIDPLDLLMKRNRSGLGVEDLLPPKKIPKGENSGPALSQDKIQEYQSFQRDRFKESKINGQLKASVAICITLDSEKDITNNPILPKQFMPKEEEPTEDKLVLDYIPMSLAEKVESLSDIIMYLRFEHFYCFYCASKFTSTEDLEGYCPGPNEEDHEL